LYCRIWVTWMLRICGRALLATGVELIVIVVLAPWRDAVF
jgi:hypothetical protein